MEYQWYYAENRQQKGPVSSDELKALLNSGSLPATTLVWRAGLPDWQPATNFPELREPATQEAPEKPSEVEPLLPLQEASHGEPAPPEEFPQGADDLLAVPEAPVYYAGIWRRFWALLLDDLIGGMVITIPMRILAITLSKIQQEWLPLSGLMGDSIATPLIPLVTSFLGSVLIALFLEFVYSGFFLSRYGATPGKMALGIQVVRSDGARVSFLRGGSRSLAENLSAWLLYMGHLLAVFDDQKRTLHDHICDTRVVMKG